MTCSSKPDDGGVTDSVGPLNDALWCTSLVFLGRGHRAICLGHLAPGYTIVAARWNKLGPADHTKSQPQFFRP